MEIFLVELPADEKFLENIKNPDRFGCKFQGKKRL
jgi:hypothetical protein